MLDRNGEEKEASNLVLLLIKFIFSLRMDRISFFINFSGLEILQEYLYFKLHLIYNDYMAKHKYKSGDVVFFSETYKGIYRGAYFGEIISTEVNAYDECAYLIDVGTVAEPDTYWTYEYELDHSLSAA